MPYTFFCEHVLFSGNKYFIFSPSIVGMNISISQGWQCMEISGKLPIFQFEMVFENLSLEMSSIFKIFRFLRIGYVCALYLLPVMILTASAEMEDFVNSHEGFC